MLCCKDILQATVFGGLSYADKCSLLQNVGYPFGSPQCLAIVGYQRLPMEQKPRRNAVANADELCKMWFQSQNLPFSTLVHYNQLLLLFPGKYLDAAKILQELYERIKADSSEVSFHIGAALSEDALSLEQSYKNAQVARQISRQRDLQKPYLFNPCGLSEFILTMPESEGSEHLTEFVHHVLLPLETYDKKNKSLLIQTLEAYLQENGNLLRTSNRLLIHRNTLKYRLHHIEEICGCSLEDAETRFVLYFALTVRQYIPAYTVTRRRMSS